MLSADAVFSLVRIFQPDFLGEDRENSLCVNLCSTRMNRGESRRVRTRVKKLLALGAFGFQGVLFS